MSGGINGELIARGLVLLAVLGLPLFLLLGDRSSHGVEIRGVTPSVPGSAEGGWSLESLTAEVGVPVTLRLTSDDVMHGFAVGRHNLQPVDVRPGRFTHVTLTFDRPGIYSYYCTRWCGPNHWWMRGTIAVTRDGKLDIDFDEPPPYETLGLDIDAPHAVDVTLDAPPSARRGATLVGSIPPQYLADDVYLTQTPDDVRRALRAEPSSAGLRDGELWDLVAFAWQAHRTPGQRQLGRALYAANCAACHGVSGGGDGVFAGKLGNDRREPRGSSRPAAFTDATEMLGASSALLDGKIRRGGMGSAMPSFATILTDEQIRALVAYLWTFPFPE